MLTDTRLERIRATLPARFLANRRRTAQLFDALDPAAYYTRPIALRHPIVFYEGHIPAFAYNALIRAALGGPSVDASLEKLFERGIDPANVDEAARHARESWPSREIVLARAETWTTAVLHALQSEDLTDEYRSPLFRDGHVAYMVVEHEELHHETLFYMLHRLAPESKRFPQAVVAERDPLSRGRVVVHAGRATLGARRGAIEFGWDNEFDEMAVEVPAFEIDVNNVTNGEWLHFVQDGGPVPPFWIARGSGFNLLSSSGEIVMPATWPVYTTQRQAAAYARWRGAALPSEAQFHRAAYGTPHGPERRYPWGDDPPALQHGNFGFRRLDPESVGISPAGRSAWGVNDLIGNGWEWTSSEFAPYDGFAPMPAYPLYSTDFFDGDHYVIKGASPVTNCDHIRRSFRNWYRPDYPYMFATFRCIYEDAGP